MQEHSLFSVSKRDRSSRTRGLGKLASGFRHNFLRIVEGQGSWLDKNSESSGLVDLTGARAHWWILKENVDKDSGHVAPGGHIAALYQNELYEMMIGRAGLARLQGFGVIFGTDRVVIYLEPNSTTAQPVTSNTARTQLLIEGEPLDWSGWAAEFRAKTPDELVALQDRIGSSQPQRRLFHRTGLYEGVPPGEHPFPDWESFKIGRNAG